MPEPRTYKVLAPRKAGDGVGYADLGEHEADRAERAVEMAVDAGGDAGVDKAIAIPVGNWTECSVEEDTRPRFKAKRIGSVPPLDPIDPNLGS